MAHKRRIGIFWGNNSLYFAETSDGQAGRLFSASIGDPTDANKSMAVSALIKESLQKAGLIPAPVQLSLATKDIIFRSFLIPWMQASEIKSAVAFEAPKYVPFPMEELTYAYHFFTVGEGAIKKNRIVFAAIKKDTLQSYRTALEQASLTVESIEPSSSSLIRVLVSKNVIPASTCLALIEKGEVNCKITIVDNGIPQFVREFQLNPTGQDREGAGGKAATNRLLNEIRISLDFYQRQDPNAQLKQIQVVSTLPSKDLTTAISEEMKVPVAISQPKLLLKRDDANEIGFLNALGAGLMDQVSTPSSFNFLGGPSKSSQRTSFVKNLRFSAILPAIIFSGLIISMAVITPRFISQKPKKLLEEVNVQLGDLKDSLLEKIQEQTTTLLGKIEKLKNIRAESDAATVLEIIPKLLPPGAWLDDLTISYAKDLEETGAVEQSSEKKSLLDVAISGYAYSENTQEQFGIVSKYLFDLKNDADFVKHFQTIDLETVRSQPQDEFTVTYFKIRCK